MKQLITTIAIFLSLQSFSQQEKNEFYLGVNGGILQELPAFGMSIGGSFENINLSASFIAHDRANEKIAAIGYNIRLGQHFSVVPKAGYVFGKVYESEDTYTNPSLGTLASYHINYGSAYVEYFGKTFSIGVRFMSWYNPKKYFIYGR